MAGLLYTEVEKSLFINSDSDEYSSSDDENETGDIDAPARIRRAETVLAHRTSRIVLILEDLYNGFNEQAILRTAESFGVLNVFIIKKEYVMKYRKDSAKIAQGSKKWVYLHRFGSTADCIQACRDEGREIWVTNLADHAVPLTRERFENNPDFKFPEKLAVVVGREQDGASDEIKKAADKHVYLPMFGFAESFNVSVAAALTLQRLFDICPEARGNLTEEEKQRVRKDWYRLLAKKKVGYFDEYLDKANRIKLMDDLREGRRGDSKNPNFHQRIRKRTLKAMAEERGEVARTARKVTMKRTVVDENDITVNNDDNDKGNDNDNSNGNGNDNGNDNSNDNSNNDENTR